MNAFTFAVPLSISGFSAPLSVMPGCLTSSLTPPLPPGQEPGWTHVPVNVPVAIRLARPGKNRAACSIRTTPGLTLQLSLLTPIGHGPLSPGEVSSNTADGVQFWMSTNVTQPSASPSPSLHSVPAATVGGSRWSLTPRTAYPAGFSLHTLIVETVLQSRSLPAVLTASAELPKLPPETPSGGSVKSSRSFSFELLQRTNPVHAAADADDATAPSANIATSSAGARVMGNLLFIADHLLCSVDWWPRSARLSERMRSGLFEPPPRRLRARRRDRRRSTTSRG